MAPPKLLGPQRGVFARELAIRFRAGASIPELAAETGRLVPMIRRLLIKAGVTTKDGPMLGASDEALAAAAVERYRARRTSVGAVAADLCVPRTDVFRWLIEAGGTSTGRQIRFPDQSDQLAADYRAGATIQQLATSTGRSTETVRKELRNAGVTVRPRGIVRGTPHPKRSDPKQAKRRRTQGAEARALYEKGATGEQIALRYRRSTTWAYELLREAGTQMRSPGGRTQTSRHRAG